MLNDDRQLKDSTLSVIDASGRQISLLNDNGQLAGSEPGSPHSAHSCDEPTLIFNTQHTTATTTWMPPVVHSTITTDQHHQYQQLQQQQQPNHSSSGSKRKYHCSEPGCSKSFTTSGHLARHNRIHTGEKNFPCLFPGCQSRFSRQDNMMQHYRTHMSPKSRRTPMTHSSSTKRHSISEESTSSSPSSLPVSSHPRPRLHAHHRIRSDPYQVDPPLTIDQHISNYHRSLITPVSITSSSSLSTSTTPLSSIAPTTTNNTQLSPSQRIFQRNQYHHLHSRRPYTRQPSPPTSPPSRSTPTRSSSSSSITTTTPPIPLQSTTSTSSLSSSTSTASSSPPPPQPPAYAPPSTTTKELPTTPTFYQHRPLAYTLTDPPSSFGFTLLHPPPASSDPPPPPPPLSPMPVEDAAPAPVKTQQDGEDSSLLQLAHIVSTFG